MSGGKSTKSSIVNLSAGARDPFAFDDDGDGGEGGGAAVLAARVHIRVQQRNGRKKVTTVDGLAKEIDLKKILKAFKHTFSCNGSLAKKRSTGGGDDEDGSEGGDDVIQLQGDHRLSVRNFLLAEELASKENIIMHGC